MALAVYGIQEKEKECLCFFFVSVSLAKMDGWMREFNVTFAQLHKVEPNRHGNQHSNEARCTYGTG